MPRKKKSDLGTELGKAKLLDEAAEIKLKAAEKMSRANAILGDSDDEDDAPELTHPQFSRSEPVAADPEPAEAPLSNFEAALADLNGRGRFEVFKLSMTGKRVKVGSYGLDEYPERMDSIAQEHGGGSFRILLKDERGQYVCSTTEDYDTKSYGGNKPAEALNAIPSIDRLMERMDAREADHRREMESMRLENQRLMLTMVEKMSAPRQETSIVDAIKLVKELQGEQRSPMDSFREVLELANSVKEETGLAEPEHPLVAAIDKVMKVASPLLTAWVSKVAAPPPASGAKTAVAKALPASTGIPSDTHAVTPTPGETPSSVVGASTPEAEPQPESVDPRMKQYAESLFQQVSAGNAFEVVGDTIINLTPDDSLDELYTMATHPAFVGQLLAAEPRLIPHQAWLANLTSYIKKEMDDAEAQAETETAQEPAPVSSGTAQ